MSWNPALPLLAAAAAAPLLVRRRHGGGPLAGIGAAWAVLGIAGIALLAPALALPDGIPSPAASLAHLPPWQGTGDPAGGNPHLRDVTFQIQPWLLHLRRELRSGRLPFWNPHQSAGAPFWANGQSAPLFPLHLLFAALPLQLGFVVLPWLRLVAGGCGAWALGRELGLSRPAALIAAAVFPLSGMLVSFLLFPMGNALALVPWVLWAVERIAGGRGGAAPLAVAAGLQLLGGHPETSLHTALLSALYLAARGASRPGAAWRRWTGGWLLAGLLAAVQLLPLALTVPETARWQAAAAGAAPPFALLLAQPLRLVLPQLYGHPAAGTWWGPFNYSATAAYAGVLALPFAAAGLAAARADRRWRAVAVLLAFCFIAAYHWPVVRDLLAALPLLGRAAQHRLLFGVELALALLAGAGCDRWLAGRGRGLLAGAAAALLLLAAAWALHGDEWAARGLLREQLAWTGAGVAAAAAAALSLRLAPSRRWAIWPLLPAVVLADLVLAHAAIPGALPLARLYPQTGAVRFLEGRGDRVAGTGEALRPNAALVYGLDDVRGDDPVKLARQEAVYRTFAPADPVYSRPIERWDAPWLDRLGLRWVLGGPGERAPADGWRLAYAGPDARVWERPAAQPLVRWEGAASRGPAWRAETLRREPGEWRVAWRAPRRALLVVAETRAPGWSAEAGGEELAFDPAGGPLLAVRLGPGAGALDLRYRPPGWAAARLASAVGALALAVLAWRVRTARAA
ncbi:MAG TPA: YfhO family protein [Thermoanaerobaculia bacterium]|nr:YfhO family protein [Thermoanaerobaculia bacterium]